MKALIKLLAARPVATVMIIASIILAGCMAAFHLPLDFLPDVSLPRIAVAAEYPGLPAKDMRSMVSMPLEDGLASTRGLRKIESVSRDGRVIIIMDFAWGEDPLEASMRVRESIDAVYPSLPEGALKPIVMPYDPVSKPVMSVAFRAKGGDAAFARRMADNEIRTRFQRVAGVSAVTIVGGRREEIKVLVDTERAASRGYSAYSVSSILSREHQDVPAGSVNSGDSELVVITKGRTETPEALSALLLPGASGGHGFRLGEIASVSPGFADRQSAYALDGEEWILLEARKRPGSNPIAVAAALRKEVARAQADFDRDFELRIVSDESGQIADTIRNLAISAAIGAAIAIAVLAFFTKNLRSSLILGTMIPISIASAIAALWAGGLSINTMSLGGLALGIGMMTDNAVVILDALKLALGKRRERPSADEIAEAAATVAGSTFGSTATTIIVFAPVLFLPGVIGALFKDLAVAVIASIVASCLSAILFVPSLYRLFYAPEPESTASHKIEKAYGRALASSLRRPWFAASLAIGLGIAGAVSFIAIPKEFMPPDGAVSLEAIVEYPPGVTLDYLERQARAVTGALRGSASVSLASAWAGAEKEDTGRLADPDLSNERIVAYCALKDGANPLKALSEIEKLIRRTAAPEAKVSVRVPEDASARILGVGGRGKNLLVKADSPEKAEAAADSIADRLAAAGMNRRSISISPTGKRLELSIAPNPEAMSAVGINFAQTSSAIKAAVEGEVATTMVRDGREVDIRVKSADPPTGPAGLAEMPVALTKGGSIAAASVLRIARAESAPSVLRRDRSDAALIRIDGSDKDYAALVRALPRLKADFPALDYLEGSALAEYGTSLLIAGILVVVLLYLYLGGQFESLSLPLVLMTTIPLSFGGIGLGLLAAGSSINFGSALGIIVLFGIVVNNSIIMQETIEGRIRAARGIDPLLAVYRGSIERVVPIMVTVMTNCLALVPIALSPSGASQRAMCVAVLGGMTASTCLTLFLVPTFFFFYYRGKAKA